MLYRLIIKAAVQETMMRITRAWRSAAIVGMLAVVGAAPAGALNVLDNPDFDDGISGWSDTSFSTLSWDELTDVNGDPASGCLILAQDVGATSSGGARSECVRVDPNVDFVLGASFLIASGQGGIPRVLVTMAVYGSDDCSGSAISAPGTDNVAIEDTWFEKTRGGQMPANARSTRVGLLAFNGDTTEFVVRVDQVYLELETLFDDGFEDGTTDAWSDSVGELPTLR